MKIIDLYKDFEEKIVKHPLYDHKLLTSVITDSARGGVNADYPTEVTYCDIEELVEFFPFPSYWILFVPHEYIEHLSDIKYFSSDISTFRKDHKHMSPVGRIMIDDYTLPVFKYSHTFFIKGYTSYKGSQVYQLLLVMREERDINHISIINCTLPHTGPIE